MSIVDEVLNEYFGRGVRPPAASTKKAEMITVGCIWGICAALNLWYHGIRCIVDALRSNVDGGDKVSTGY